VIVRYKLPRSAFVRRWSGGEKVITIRDWMVQSFDVESFREVMLAN